MLQFYCQSSVKYIVRRYNYKVLFKPYFSACGFGKLCRLESCSRTEHLGRVISSNMSELYIA